MGVHQHFVFIWIVWFNSAFSFSCNLILLYLLLVENVSTYYQHHINSGAVSGNTLARMRAYISYIIYILVDKASCTTQCHDLSRGSVVSVHNMSQRQRTDFSCCCGSWYLWGSSSKRWRWFKHTLGACSSTGGDLRICSFSKELIFPCLQGCFLHEQRALFHRCFPFPRGL